MMASRLSLQQHDLDLRQRWAPPVTMSIHPHYKYRATLSAGSVREGAVDRHSVVIVMYHVIGEIRNDFR